jgi:hypothetical protein
VRQPEIPSAGQPSDLRNRGLARFRLRYQHIPTRTTGTLFLVLSSFLASTVEMVEALIIVLAVGVSQQWHSTLIGVLVAPAALVPALGPAFGVHLLPGARKSRPTSAQVAAVTRVACRE